MKKILIVEDDEVIRKLYVDEMRVEGFSVIFAENGQKGLEAALSEKPDLILLDILMPVMDGMEMMQELRKDSWGKDVVIIILTNAITSEKIAQEMVESKLLYFLIKSEWSLKDVVDKIKKILNETKEGV